MKAADLDASDIVELIRLLRDQDNPWYAGALRPRWVMFDEIAAAYPDVPHKVVRAKLKRMMFAKLITGCVCGCRGDFELVA